MNPRESLRRILGNNLRRERLALHLSQEVLAERAGLSQVYVSKVETAKAAASIDAIEKLAIAIGKDPTTLLRKP